MVMASPLLLGIILGGGNRDDAGGGAAIEKDLQNDSPPTLPNSLRDLPLNSAVASLSTPQLLAELAELDAFRRTCDNLYHRVRALFFLYAVHRFHLPERRRRCRWQRAATGETKEGGDGATLCPAGYACLLDRRFEEAIDCFLASVPWSADAIDVSGSVDGAEVAAAQSSSGHAPPSDYSHLAPRRISLVSDLTFHSQDDPQCHSHHRGSGGDNHSFFARPCHQHSFTQQSPPPKSSVLMLPSDATSSALAKAYRALAFQTLADQVKASVRSHPGNEWMFLVATAAEQPLRFVDRLGGAGSDRRGPVLRERTPVRMDLSHSCWSDIFFLAMDYPAAARVVNCSVDLAVRDGGDGTRAAAPPVPPIECWLRLTGEDPGTIRLTSVDLHCTARLTHSSEVFDFGADHLGLLKAGLVAGGIVPLGLERGGDAGGRDVPLEELLAVMAPPALREDSGDGRIRCRYGLEITTHVHNIPKGSRLAVSTNLLGSIIALCMRATSQTASLVGPLLERERRSVTARAILGEYLGGSGGGWQDSGGLWPGLKLIHGVEARESDPEWGLSAGRLLPDHILLQGEDAPPELLRRLEDSLVLVHGGMAQNVGPILEMVTEKYLLREEEEWRARHRSMGILDELLVAFKNSNVREVARLVTENFFGPIRAVIPWATNLYTETLISRVRARFGVQLWGFWMLGGMSGGGMGFIFDPAAKARALEELKSILRETKQEMECSLPFAKDPVVFDFKVNENGTVAEWVHQEELDTEPGVEKICAAVCGEGGPTLGSGDLEELLQEQGFDRNEHEQLRSDLRDGTIGLAKNRLGAQSELKDVGPDDVIVIGDDSIGDTHRCGLEALRAGSVGVVTLAAGVGSRWTQGAGVVKSLHPFCCIGGKHRNFIDVHLAKNRRISAEAGTPIPHIFTTSWLTDAPISSYIESLKEENDNCTNRPIYISKGQSIGLRLIPMVRDLKFLWNEQSHQQLDTQAQKVRDSTHSALMSWAELSGQGMDYVDNVPSQCLCPVGHWYEIPNLLLNGTLAEVLKKRPQLKTLMLHNIDTIGADVDAKILGRFLESESTLAYEVVPRCIDDMGGGLCCVNGKVRLVEGLALPREEDELKLSYYNSLTTWIDIDKLLSKFGLSREDILEKSNRIPPAINAFSRRLPTYVTIKDVKKRWGKGHEDVHPVTQYEKLWGDMSSVDGITCSFFVVTRQRGQQLKDPSQLDEWSRDGSAAFLSSICSW